MHNACMRVLFSSVGAIGHVYPMVPLAQALARHGHEVRWASSPDLCPTIEQTGISAFPAGMTAATRKARRDERIKELAKLSPDQLTDELAPWAFGELMAPAMLQDLLPVVREWQPALIVHDSMEFAAPVAAAHVRAIHVAHSFGPLSPEHRIAAIAERVTPLWQRVGLEPMPYGGLYDHLYLDIYPPSIQPARGDHVSHCQLLRPTAYPSADGTELPPDLAVEPERPLIYVTFGTEVPDQRALQLVIDAVAGLPVRVLATIGAHGDPGAFDRQRPGVVVERFVPQAAVLPRAAAVVSHGGSGTVLATLAAGVPQLCIPYFADQPLNARAISGAGAGLTLEIDTLDGHDVAQAVTRLLTEPGFAERSAALAAEITQMPSADDIAAKLAELVAN
jgi:UDP:flavonoid glycosyltransferase YjiC (YdhE family)